MEPLLATEAAHGLQLLQQHGLCWLDSVLDPTALGRLREEAHRSFAELLAAVSSRQEEACRGLPAHLHQMARLPVQSAEVVERDGGRFDCRHGCDGLLGLLDEPSGATLAAVLQAALGPELAVVAHGQVVALSEEGRASYLSAEAAEAGASAQAWHADGPHLFGSDPEDGSTADSLHGGPPTLPAHALTVFLPLAEVTEAAGPTEFALGTHRARRSLPEAEAAGGGAPETVRLLAPAGAAVVFDYRVWHRGLPNRQVSTHRHVAYLVVARPWWRDHRNHLHTGSIFEAAEAAAEEEEAEEDEEDEENGGEAAAGVGGAGAAASTADGAAFAQQLGGVSGLKREREEAPGGEAGPQRGPPSVRRDMDEETLRRAYASSKTPEQEAALQQAVLRLCRGWPGVTKRYEEGALAASHTRLRAASTGVDTLFASAILEALDGPDGPRPSSSWS